MFHVKPPPVPRIATALVLTLALNKAVRAESSASQVSEASMLPVAISVALPVVLVAGAGSIVVTGVQASTDGTVWLVENVADGVKGSIRFAGRAVGGTLVVAGTVVAVTVIGTGMVLSTASRAIAFIPNEIGRSLSYNQKVSP